MTQTQPSKEWPWLHPDELSAEYDQLKALNAELLAALKATIEAVWASEGYSIRGAKFATLHAETEKAERLIAKAEGR